jgi:hypothetical protein
VGIPQRMENKFYSTEMDVHMGKLKCFDDIYSFSELLFLYFVPASDILKNIISETGFVSVLR